MQLIIFGECSSKGIFLGGVEIKLVDFGGNVVPFQENLVGDKKIYQKSSRMGEVGICSKKWGEVSTSPTKWGI